MDLDYVLENAEQERFMMLTQTAVRVAGFRRPPRRRIVLMFPLVLAFVVMVATFASPSLALVYAGLMTAVVLTILLFPRLLTVLMPPATSTGPFGIPSLLLMMATVLPSTRFRVHIDEDGVSMGSRFGMRLMPWHRIDFAVLGSNDIFLRGSWKLLIPERACESADAFRSLSQRVGRSVAATAQHNADDPDVVPVSWPSAVRRTLKIQGVGALAVVMVVLAVVAVGQLR